jgi:hypothetical protein
LALPGTLIAGSKYLLDRLDCGDGGFQGVRPSASGPRV